MALLALAGASLPVWAGPPFVTDDPEPVEYKHWEIYGFSSATFVRGDSAGVLPGIEVNYGAVPNVQLHVVVPVAFNSQPITGSQFGYGDTEFGVKYRFVSPGDEDWWPQVGVFPMLVAPTGDAARGLGTGSTHAFLPLWFQKDMGKWTTYGGGGYWINPGQGNKSYWFLGWQLQRKVAEDLIIGGEIFRQTASTTSGPGSVGFPLGSQTTIAFDLGGILDLTEHDHLLFSAGRGLQNSSATNEFSYYLAYQYTF